MNWNPILQFALAVLAAAVSPLMPAVAQSPQTDRQGANERKVMPVNYVGDGHVDLSPCFTALIADVEIPAQESGPLISMSVREGQLVSVGQQLAKIDDAVALLRLETARTKLDSANEKANNDIDVRAAQNALNIAERERKTNQDLANKGALPRQEYERSALQAKQAALQLEQARRDMETATKDAQVESFNVRAATDSIKRHSIQSPIDGNVMELYKEAGEWVNAGDNVMRVARLDRLYVQGLLDSTKFDPHEVDGRTVSVALTMARGQQTEFHGRIVFVSYEKNSSKFYSVRAEVENRNVNGRWLLLAGEEVTMRIHLDGNAVGQIPHFDPNNQR